MTWHDYLITPQAPLVFKSGRPFAAGVRDGANFPWPSSVAGLLRTTLMQKEGWDLSGPSGGALQEKMLDTAAGGPFLIRETSGKMELMAPRPADVLFLLDFTLAATPFKLAPAALPANSGCDLPNGLRPVMLEKTAPKGKPQKAPAFWTLSEMLDWRMGKMSKSPLNPLKATELLTKDLRTQVAINPLTYAAKDGALLQMEGLDFGYVREGKGYGQIRYHVGARFSEQLQNGMVCFGGRRRMSWLEDDVHSLYAMSPEYRQQLEKSSGAISLTLLTPGLFDGGWKPGWLSEGADGNEGSPPGVELRLRLVSAALERWQPVSGWDLHLKQPKRFRKVVPAGSVYWFEVLEGTADELQKLWFAAVSDQAQDRRDGFGVALPGPWKV